MSHHLRRRKPPDGDGGDAPPDLSECASSSWDDGDADGGRREGLKLTAEPPSPAPAPTPGALDRFLSTYGAFSSKTFTADQGLKIIQWSSWAISYATSSTRAILSPSLRALYGEVSFARYILRFYGFPQSLEGYRSGSWAGGSWKDPRIARIAKYLMAGSMLLYYPLEHVAYAGWKMPKLLRGVDANRVSAVSCVFWTAYIVGDFWASCLKWGELGGRLKDLRRALVGKKWDDEDGTAAELQEEEHALLKSMRHVKLQALRCLLFILPAVNWSLPNWATDPLLSEFSVNGLMLAEAYASVYQSLRSMLG